MSKDNKLLTQGKEFAEKMKSKEAELFEQSIRRTTQSQDNTFITRGGTYEFEKVMDFARVPTIGGDHSRQAREAWEERVDDETKIWRLQKKKLEKNII